LVRFTQFVTGRHLRNFDFEAPREEVSKCKALPIGWFGESQDYHLGALKYYPKFDACL
jgi:hypothetical protein